MTIKEIKEMYKNEYSDIEIYRNFNSKNIGFHTDRIKATEEYDEETEVIEYSLADEEEYNQTVLANTSSTADFNEWYGDKNAKILLVKVS